MLYNNDSVVTIIVIKSDNKKDNNTNNNTCSHFLGIYTQSVHVGTYEHSSLDIQLPDQHLTKHVLELL